MRRTWTTLVILVMLVWGGSATLAQPLAQYTFNDGSTTDITGNGNDGALVPNPIAEPTREIYIAMAYKQFEAKRYARALPLFRKAETSDPDDPYVLNAIGACALKLNRWELALRYYERVLEREPNHPQTIKGIACARKALGLE